MKVYIFSNCKKSDIATYERNLLAKVPLDAKIVILNRGEVYYKVKAFKRYPDQTMILRKCGTHGLSGYWGLQNLVGSDRQKCIKELIEYWDEESRAILKIGHPDCSVTEKIVETPWHTEYVKQTGRVATTGFASYYLVQSLYGVRPGDIFLVNFYGNNDASTGKWNGHAWDVENQWLQNKQRIYC